MRIVTSSSRLRSTVFDGRMQRRVVGSSVCHGHVDTPVGCSGSYGAGWTCDTRTFVVFVPHTMPIRRHVRYRQSVTHGSRS